MWHHCIGMLNSLLTVGLLMNRCPQPDCRHEMDVAALRSTLTPEAWTALLDMVREKPGDPRYGQLRVQHLYNTTEFALLVLACKLP